jgi:hypothetical protein
VDAGNADWESLEKNGRALPIVRRGKLEGVTEWLLGKD